MLGNHLKKKRLEYSDVCFYRRLLTMKWETHLINEQCLLKITTTKACISTITTRQIQFPQHIMKAKGFDILREYIKVKKNRTKSNKLLKEG